MEFRLMSVLVLILLQAGILASIVSLVTNFISGVPIRSQGAEDLLGIRPSAEIHHDGCNVTFVPTPIFSPMPFLVILMPNSRLDFTAQKCLLSSLADQAIYQISCVLLTVALLFVLTLFLIMGMFIMDMIYHVGRAVVDTGVHTASTK